MSKWDNTPKRFIFEDKEKTLFETNDITEMNRFLYTNKFDLEQYMIMDTVNYTHICYYGYTLMIKK